VSIAWDVQKELSERLTSVMAQSCPSCDKDSAVRAASAPLADDIYEMAEQISRMNEAYRALLLRVEL